ncbi:MAG: ribosome silencing factor [Bacteroidaceae bacterium]|nr:ribosome silencing factor [Bacteroidaceae bacterium]
MSEKIETKTLLKEITEAIQEKKGKDIVIADLTKLGNTICDYFVICNGNSPTQVSAIADSVEYLVKQAIGYRPIAIDGQRNALWIAMDYGEVLVHIFLPETREFYDIDHLWADAKLEIIPDID